jgi:DNA-binding PadR family transcriptional regulator
MARAHPDEIPTHMAVTGLVIERPRQTVAWYAKALAERFPQAAFAASAAYNALRQMERGSPAPRVVCTYRHPGEDRTLDRYEATPKGRADVREWMFRPPTETPAVRQAMYGRVELARLPDLPLLIRIYRMEEKIATGLYAEANLKMRKHRIVRRSANDEERMTQAELERAMRETWLYVGPLHWSHRAELCMKIIELLEEIADEAGIDIPADEDDDGEHEEVRAS